jgi:hypothetical protein
MIFINSIKIYKVETFKNAPPHFIGLINKIRALGKIIDPKKLLRYDKEKNFKCIRLWRL